MCVSCCVCVCVYTQNRTEARRVMQSRNPPHNCSQAFSKDGDQIFNNRFYSAEQSRANYLSGDVEDEIRCVLVCVKTMAGHISMAVA